MPMKAIVTGGAGFIGSHLTDALIAIGAEVHVIDNLSTGDAARVHPSAELHAADVRSPAARSAVVSAKPDIMFHLAAQADVQRSMDDPDLDLSVNVSGTLNMLEACREAGVRKFVFASTSGVYGDLQRDLMREDDPVDPISYYGLSKLTAERYIRLYDRHAGVPYTILRYGNVYGPRQTSKGEGGVVAIFMERILKGLPLTIHGDGRQTRDFVYVQDILQANLAAAERGSGETLHVSTGKPTSVNQLVELLRRIHPAEIAAEYGPARSGDIVHSCLSNRLTRTLLRWQPACDIEHGLRETYRHWLKT